LTPLADLEQGSALEIVSWAIASFGRHFGIATSFQKEGMALIDMAVRIDPAVRVFTLDTGRLPQETFQMIETVRRRYGIAVEVASPDAEEVSGMVTEHGPNLFRQSEEMRRLCCEVRKTRPLERKLAEFRAWATGLRRGQSSDRFGIGKVQETGGKIKLNPLADWTDAELEEYNRRHDVPVHPLYAAGYASIGCAPCSRAIEPGEDARAGRWWWETGGQKECGIHFLPDGSVRRLDSGH
jgi:phosphoadenylyl-sulfate reductase (thioredoxin)